MAWRAIDFKQGCDNKEELLLKDNLGKYIMLHTRSKNLPHKETVTNQTPCLTLKKVINRSPNCPEINTITVSADT